MSRHLIESYREHVPVLVVAGYDRPLRSLYLQVWEDPTAHSHVDQSILYASHLDLSRDWSDIDSVAEVLERLAIVVPDSFIAALQEDQCHNRGNRISHHPPASMPALGT